MAVETEIEIQDRSVEAQKSAVEIMPMMEIGIPLRIWAVIGNAVGLKLTTRKVWRVVMKI